MSQSAEDSFVYVTFIRTTAEKLWSALTDADQMKEYWLGMHIETEWKTGAKWQMLFPDGRVADSGEILEVERPKRIRAMSRIGGCSAQPESAMRSRTSTGAPQCGQVLSAPSLGIRQYGQV